MDEFLKRGDNKDTQIIIFVHISQFSIHHFYRPSKNTNKNIYSSLIFSFIASIIVATLL